MNDSCFPKKNSINRKSDATNAILEDKICSEDPAERVWVGYEKIMMIFDGARKFYAKI